MTTDSATAMLTGLLHRRLNRYWSTGSGQFGTEGTFARLAPVGSGRVVAEVPRASAVEGSTKRCRCAAGVRHGCVAANTGFERAAILNRVADLIDEHARAACSCQDAEEAAASRLLDGWRHRWCRQC